MEEGRDPHVRLGGVAATASAAAECEVLVIGGGTTGVGVARDAAMRGFSVILVERGDLATGTTGRLSSGCVAVMSAWQLTQEFVL